MTVITREDARYYLWRAGVSTHAVMKTNMGKDLSTLLVMTAVACAESGLSIDAYHKNTDGSEDLGLWQINNLAWPAYSRALLLSDALYNAHAAYSILHAQGVTAWAAYNVKSSNGAYPYVRHLPPNAGGPSLFEGNPNQSIHVVKSWQKFLNMHSADTDMTLVVDGAFGPNTYTATKKWKILHHNDGNVTVDGRTWEVAGLF